MYNCLHAPIMNFQTPYNDSHSPIFVLEYSQLVSHYSKYISHCPPFHQIFVLVLIPLEQLPQPLAM